MEKEFRIIDNSDLDVICGRLKDFLFDQTSMIGGYVKNGSDRSFEARVDKDRLHVKSFRLKVPRREKFISLSVSDIKKILDLAEYFKDMTEMSIRFTDHTCRCASEFPKFISTCSFSGF